MSAILTAKGLAAGHADRLLFSGLDLVIAPGEITGLVGANGAGKSTLLRILAGLVPPDQGEVGLSPPAATVGYLSQEPERRPGESTGDFIARRTGVARAQQDLDEATALLVQEKPGADDAYATALERWLALGGADLEERAAAVFTTLGLPADAGREAMTSLSGGQAARVNLASLLLSRYDVFLLDEPTNDLDIAGLEILEGFVRGLRAGTVLVSHDRAFLERTVHRVLELDLAQQQVRLYGGGYLAYLEERQIAREHAREDYEKYADTRAGLQERMRTQIGWADKGVRRPGPRRPTTTSTSCTGRSPVRKSWRARSRPRSGCWTAWTSSPSRARSGSSKWRSPPRPGPARWPPRCATRSSNAAVSAWPGQPPGQLGRPDRHHGPERGRQVDPHRSAPRPATAGVGSRVPGQRHQVGEVDQARSLFDGEVPLLEAFAAQVPTCSQRTSGRCWPSTDWWPATCCARRARCRRASGPGRPWRCSRPGA
jgi:ABC-type multidrug transport system ATPase subunit